MSRITVIGEVKVKVTASGYREINRGFTTPAMLETEYVGTGQAIAKRLNESGEEVVLISALGDDFIGRAAKADMAAAGINVNNVKLLENLPTPVEVMTLNIIGDMEWYLVNEVNRKFIDVETVKSVLDVINGSDMLAIDATLSKEVLEFIVENVTVPVFMDPGTEEDAEKVKDIIGKFEVIKPNRAEASVLYGKDIFSEEELRAACDYFMEQGVKKVYITMSGGGVFYRDAEKDGFIRPEEVLNFVRKDGAGDAFCGAIVDGTVKGMDIEAIAAYGMEEAAKVMKGKKVIDPNELLWGDPID